jgi:hypothetical protein
MSKRKRGSNLLRFNSIPPSILGVTIAASWFGMVGTIVLGYPLWVIGLVTFLPWIPILCSEAFWKYRHYAWFALFEMLLVVQCLHMIEHFAQVIEVDVIGWPRLASTGIFGTLNIEYVHFTFDTFLMIGTTILLFGKFRRNIPLWIAWVVSIWHAAEHWYITYFYTFDYPNYDPNNPNGLHAHEGMLGHGGLLWPSSPFQRIELHFLYNFIYTLPLLWAFVLVIREAYDEHLRRVFPSLTKSQLISLDRSLESLQAEPGEIIIHQGTPADRFYIISKGEVEVIQEMNGQAMVISVLSRGQFFGDVGLLTGAPRSASVRTRTYCDLLALDREAFRAAVGAAPPVAQASPPAMAPQSVTQTPIPATSPPASSGWSGQITSPTLTPLPPAPLPTAEIIGK